MYGYSCVIHTQVYIKVRVTPGSKRESLEETGENTYTVLVKEPAKQNRANTRVRELLAHHIGVEPKRLRLVSGHRSPSKIFSVS